MLHTLTIDDRSAELWLDGQWTDAADTGCSFQSSAVLYGASVFDNARAYRSPGGWVVYGLRQHLERFHRSAGEAVLKIGPSDELLVETVHELLRRRDVSDDRWARVRLFAFGTSGDLCGPDTSLAVFGLPTGGYAPARPRLCFGLTRRATHGDVPRSLKSASAYLYARREVHTARQRGFDDIVVLNEHDRVSEASRANLVLVSGDSLVTPPTSEGALAGVTRSMLQRIASSDGIDWQTRPVSAAELRAADSVLLTSSSLGVVTAGGLEDRAFGPNAVADHLTTRYSSLPETEPDNPDLVWAPGSSRRGGQRR